MKTSVLQYARALRELLDDSSQDESKKIITDFIGFVVKNNDYHRLDEILHQLEIDILKEKGELVIDLISARALSKEAKLLIDNYLKNKTGSSKVKINEIIDPKIIGGFVIRYDNKIVDGSVKQNLLHFQKQLSN
jgi:F-type H+-transporting ATPase subunit delta